MYVTHLECGACGATHEAGVVHTTCSECGKPLLVRYDLRRAGKALTREALRWRSATMWRYREVLPPATETSITTLGEGFTPLLPARALGMSLGLRELYVKDESQNPTLSFKARGMSTAVSMARELGITALATPSAGNAASALAAYAALAGIPAWIFMPADTPTANRLECEVTGARVTLIDGLITDCAAEVARRKENEGWFDVATLREPYRVEGKKTLGYELAEQLQWNLPDVIIYPTGGGTGLIGMWKAFAEMEALGWIGAERPRMVVVQSETCAPIVRAFEQGERFATEFADARTCASGLRVPRAIGDFLILDAVRESGGTALSVSDAELIAGARELARSEGIFACPEGGACVPALRRLLQSGVVRDGERVVIFNTGSGVKYPECFL
ncbi:MAG TPA: threonine synthase [Gemmatimonadaceae bacterium]